LIHFQCGGLRNISSEFGAEFCHVVGEERGLVAGAGDGNIAESRVEQIRVDTDIGVDENAFGREALRAMTGDGIAVVEMTMVACVELDLAVVVEAGEETAIRRDSLDDGEVTIGNAELRFSVPG
jgi:hypothetical protein